jgi:hypothetical protein
MQCARDITGQFERILLYVLAFYVRTDYGSLGMGDGWAHLRFVRQMTGQKERFDAKAEVTIR